MRNCLIIAATLLTGIVTASAEEPLPLSLQEAQQLAIEHHPRISEAGLLALASKQSVREARSAFFPTITANATAVDATAQNTRIAAGALNNSLILTRNAEGINITQIITDFGRTASLTASSKEHSRAQEQNAIATRAQMLLAVNVVFFRALEAQSVLAVATQTVKSRQLVFDQVNELAKNKLKSGLDLSFAKVNLADARLLLANAQNDLQSQFASLSNLLGEREQHNYLLRNEPATLAAPPDASSLVQLALRDRPDLAQLRFEREAAGSFAQAEKDLFRPTISAVGTAGIIPVHDQQLRANYAAAGVNLSIPIFEGMLFSARSKEAQLRAQAAAENLRAVENDVIRDVRVAVLDAGYAAEQVTLTEQLLASANEAFELAQARYQVGSSSIVELSQAQLSQTQAEIAQARAKFEYQIRDSVLNFQTGQLK
ncbi:MAG: Outer rane efflux protein [Pedosphaera sp.]|nr:Outer rane efflux protein [Pedosphaera sp.]